MIRSALGEVCYGFSVLDFERRLRGPQQLVRDLFERFDRHLEQMDARVRVSMHELDIVTNAVRETLDELGPEELSTRTGVSFDLGKEVLAKLVRQRKEVRPS